MNVKLLQGLHALRHNRRNLVAMILHAIDAYQFRAAANSPIGEAEWRSSNKVFIARQLPCEGCSAIYQNLSSIGNGAIRQGIIVKKGTNLDLHPNASLEVTRHHDIGSSGALILLSHKVLCTYILHDRSNSKAMGVQVEMYIQASYMHLLKAEPEHR